MKATQKRVGLGDWARLPNELESDIIRRIQDFCADIAERKEDTRFNDDGLMFQWTVSDAEQIAGWLNAAEHPWDLFTFIDEKTGHFTVGYETSDGRDWFHILRQMRNTVGSGLFETLSPRYG